MTPPVLIFSSDAASVRALIDCLNALGMHASHERAALCGERIGVGAILGTSEPDQSPGTVHDHYGDDAIYVRLTSDLSERRKASNPRMWSYDRNHALLIDGKPDAIDIAIEDPEAGLAQLLARLGYEAEIARILAKFSSETRSAQSEFAQTVQVEESLGDDRVSLRREATRLRVENDQMRVQLERVKNSRVFALFDLWRYSRNSIKGMLLFPARALRTVLFSRGAVKSVRDRRSLLDLSRASAKLSAVQAREMVDEHTQRVDGRTVNAMNLVAANVEVEDEPTWLSYINRYFGYFNLASLELASPGTECGSRFLRVGSKSGRSLNGPLISVIMPAYNSADTLLFAARSVLNQTWQNVQLIIVDDCSDDATLGVAQELAAIDSRVVVLQNATNVGPYVSKNRALRHCAGVVVTGHDADDWAHPARLESQIAPMLDGVARATISCMFRMQHDGSMTKFGVEGSTCPDGAMRIASITAMFDKRFFVERLGHWDSVRFAADSELIGRARLLLSDAEFVQLNFPSMICLDDATSLTNNPDTGIDPVGGMSGVRAEYRANWIAWHQKIRNSDQCQMAFPLLHRPFKAPAAMQVPVHDVESSVRSEQKADVCTLDVELN